MKYCRYQMSALLLALALLSSLTACGETEAELRELRFKTAPAYNTEVISLPSEGDSLCASCTDGGIMYFLTAGKAENGEIPYILCRADLVSDTVETAAYSPVMPEASEDGTAAAYPDRLAISPDGALWVWETRVLAVYDLPADFDEAEDDRSGYLAGLETSHFLRRLDAETGETAEEINISEAVRELGGGPVQSWTVDGKRNIYLASSGKIAVLDDKGRTRFILDTGVSAAVSEGTSGGTVVLLSDGSAAAIAAAAGKEREVRVIDPSAQDWSGARYQIPGKVNLVYGGSGEFLFYYMEDGALYGWVPGESGARRLLSWDETELTGAVMCFAPREDGSVAALTSSGGSAGSGGTRLSRLLPTDERQDGRTVLTYGAAYTPDWVRCQIREFNQKSRTHYIELKDYGEGLDWSAGVWPASTVIARKRANAAFAAGEIPDILDGFNLPLHTYAVKGLLEDLWPYIDGDEELGGREALMGHVLDCASMDGKLYTLPNGFSIETVMGRADIIGDRKSWTVGDILEIYDSMPEGSTVAGPGMPWNMLVTVLIDFSRYVDWDKGTCSFDSQEFRSLLELCRRFAEEADGGNTAFKTNLWEGRQVMAVANIYDAHSFIKNEALCGGQDALWDYAGLLRENQIDTMDVKAASYMEADGRLAAGALTGAVKDVGYAAYPGYPVEGGAGGAFTLEHTVAISAACKDKEGAWTFVRQFLLPGGNLRKSSENDGSIFTARYSFPINKADFENQMHREPVWFVDKNGEYILDKDGQRIEMSQGFIMAGGTGADGSPLGLYQLAPTQAMYDRFMELYFTVSRVKTADNVISDIIAECLEPYFAGDKSLEDTTHLIQRRVGLYVNENR